MEPYAKTPPPPVLSPEVTATQAVELLASVSAGTHVSDTAAVGQQESHATDVDVGVQQGSVLGPLLFAVVLGGTTVLPWNRGTSFSRYQYRRGHGTTVVPQYH